MKIILILFLILLTACKNQMQSAVTTSSSQSSVNPAESSPVPTKEKTFAETQIMISDSNGRPVSGAVVSGQWFGNVSSTASATTNINGIAVIRSPAMDSPGSVTFKVNSVMKNGSVYDPTKNKIAQVSVSH